jgi:hypothetical protein
MRLYVKTDWNNCSQVSSFLSEHALKNIQRIYSLGNWRFKTIALLATWQCKFHADCYTQLRQKYNHVNIRPRMPLLSDLNLKC